MGFFFWICFRQLQFLATVVFPYWVWKLKLLTQYCTRLITLHLIGLTVGSHSRDRSLTWANAWGVGCFLSLFCNIELPSPGRDQYAMFSNLSQCSYINRIFIKLYIQHYHLPRHQLTLNPCRVCHIRLMDILYVYVVSLKGTHWTYQNV